MIVEKIQLLENVVSKLTSLYHEYLTVANEQRNALVNNDIEVLSAVNQKMDEFSQQIAFLEEQRIHLMEQIARLEGVDFVNIKDLKSHFECPEMDSLYLSVQSLKEALAEVRKSNNINHALIKNAREFIRSSVSLITGYGGKEKENRFQTYGSTGNVNSSKRQLRTLLNKEI